MCLNQIAQAERACANKTVPGSGTICLIFIIICNIPLAKRPLRIYTHVRNKHSNSQGRSPYVVKVIFRT